MSPSQLHHKVLVALGLASAGCGDSCVQGPDEGGSEEEGSPWFKDDDDDGKVRTKDRDEDDRDRDEDDRDRDEDDDVGPCLDVAPDTAIQVCLNVPPDTGVHPCLKVLPCLSPVEEPVGPCLEMMPCLSPPPLDACLDIVPQPMDVCLSIAPPDHVPVPSEPPDVDDGTQGRMLPKTSREDALARVLESGVLPSDVAVRLEEPS